MAYPGYGMEAASNFQGLFSNVLMALRERRAEQELSLREKAFLEEQRQTDRNYEMKLDEFDWRKKQDLFTREYQKSQMRAMDVAYNNEQANVAVAPHLAKFQSDLTSIYNPDEVRSFNPDSSFLDTLPEEQRMKANAVWQMGVQTLKDKWMAETGIAKLNREKADNLIENAYLLGDKVLQNEAMELGYLMKGGAQLPPEAREMYNRFASEIEKKRPLTSVETSAYVALAKESGDRYETNLKEMRKAIEAVEEKYKFEDLEDTKIKEKFDQDKLSAATPYILGMRKAEQERAEYSRQAMGARRTGQEDMPEETAPAQPPTPEPVKPKWADLLPMKPSQRKANQAEEKAPDKPVEAPPTVVEEGEMPKRQTIMENLEAVGQKQKEKLQEEYNKLIAMAEYTGKDKVKLSASAARKSKIAELKKKIEALP